MTETGPITYRDAGVDIAAHAFGVPMSACHVAETASDKVANSMPTAASAKRQSLREYMEGTLWNWNNWREVKHVFVVVAIECPTLFACLRIATRRRATHCDVDITC